MSMTASPRPDDPPVLRIVLVEDSALLCGMLRDMLEELDGVGVVAAAADEQDALAALERLHPDLAIIDLELRAGELYALSVSVVREPWCSPTTVTRRCGRAANSLAPSASSTSLSSSMSWSNSCRLRSPSLAPEPAPEHGSTLNACVRRGRAH